MGKGTLLVVGLIVGGALGWFTAPKPAVDIKVGGVSIEVDGSGGGGSDEGERPGRHDAGRDRPAGRRSCPTRPPAPRSSR